MTRTAAWGRLAEAHERAAVVDAGLVEDIDAEVGLVTAPDVLEVTEDADLVRRKPCRKPGRERTRLAS